MNINGLAHEINRQLALFAGSVQADVVEAADEVAKLGVSKLKAKSPVGATGEYAKGWRVKKVGTKRIVHNATDYRLTHLLEEGHATRNGERTKAQPHIKPVENELKIEFEREIRKKIESL